MPCVLDVRVRRQLCLLASLSAGVKEAALTPAAFENDPLPASDSACVSPLTNSPVRPPRSGEHSGPSTGTRRPL
ncbi:hypothetical protein MRX96_002452 [Rhipicephalus microplus]